MTGSHSRLGISDRESRTTGVIRAYDTGVNIIMCNYKNEVQFHFSSMTSKVLQVNHSSYIRPLFVEQTEQGLYP